MKLKHSISLVSFIHIHLILIHILIIHIHLSNQFETSDHQQHQDADFYDISEENKKIIIEQVKTNLLKVLGLKEVPKKPTHMAVVPPKMLENYRSYRDSVRDVIPEDRDFYGKIPVADLDQDHDNFWNEVHNRFGSYDIVVDMDQKDKTKTFDTRLDGTNMRSLISEQADISPKLERILPPHSDNFKSQKQFTSVHLKFNLSQEIFVDPIEPEKVKRAELILSREKVDDCDESHDDCDITRKPVPSSQHESSFRSTGRPHNDRKNDGVDQTTTITTNTMTKTTTTIDGQNRQDNLIRRKKFRNKPRYQKVILLLIEDYDSHGDPITRICGSQRIDTQETTPLVFNIQNVIKHWLKNPKKIFGLIIRVSNDDPEYDEVMRRETRSTSSATSIKVVGGEGEMRSTNSSTNASTQENKSISESPRARVDDSLVDTTDIVFEHVRLKREFRTTSESDETWQRKRPYILISYDHPESERHHVKRDHSAHAVETDDMQADEPSYSASNEANASYHQTTSNNTVRNTSRRDSRQANSSNQYNRNSSPTSHRPPPPPPSSATASGGGGLQRSRSKPKSSRTEDKCSRRSLSINFDEVGWSSWIIAPLAYNAYYCAGDCSYPLHDPQNATNHAIIQSIFHSVGRVVPRACCAPVKLGDMALLYQVDGGVQMKKYDDMIVESCGCL